MTKKQIEQAADTFDSRLTAMIVYARSQAMLSVESGPPYWENIAESLVNIRPTVRMMMSEKAKKARP